MGKKTVLLIRNASPQDFGGAEKYIVNLAKVLSDNETIKPIVVSRHRLLLKYARSDNLETVRGWWLHKQNWNGKNTFLLPIYLVWLAALISWYVVLILRLGADVLHVQSRDDFIAASIAGKVLGKKIIWTDHMDLRYILQDIKRPLRNTLGKLIHWSSRFADEVILISKNEDRIVRSALPEKSHLKNKIAIINNGVSDSAKFYRPSNDEGMFNFCIASRIVENKGIGDVIEAFNLLNDGHAVLDIYGKGGDLSKFKKKASSNHSIFFHGHIDDPLKAISRADVFILPSYQEGFSIALLEATMLGKAIVATNIDSNPEIITHNQTGILVNPKSPKELSEAMRRIMDDPNLKSELESHARSNYLAKYNLERIVQDRIVPLYNSST